uniref:hypothetical protein n=1 Tax=Bacillus multifaciens TaxID=3068506 RepID=UPI003F494495
MKVLLKRMDCAAELIEVEDFNQFCVQQFLETPSSDGRLWIHIGHGFDRQKFVMYVGCNMQGNFGDEHFILHRPSQRIKEMKEQMIYGNVVFAKVSTEETFDHEYIDMKEEEAEAISSSFVGAFPFGIGRIEVLEFEQIFSNLEKVNS